MSTEKHFKAWKPGTSATAPGPTPSWRDKRSFGGKGRDKEARSSTFSERIRWERATKPKIFAPSEEPPLGCLLSLLKPQDYDESSSNLRSESIITDFRTVASFNWLDAAEPAIAVPGKPPRWTPLREPRRLKPDNAEYFRDYNAARYPKHPLEPAIIAVLTLQPDIARDVDIVACGKTLDQLVNFIRGTDKTFRMLVEYIDGHVFLTRRENTPHERLSDVRGYGHSFPESYTTWDADVKTSIQHQRVTLHRFGGLRFLVRSQGDGYLPDESDDAQNQAGSASMPAGLGLKEAVDALSDKLMESRVAPNIAANEHGQLRVTSAGNMVGQDGIFELKTRSVNRKAGLSFEDTLHDHLSRLWVSQVPNFILAYHDHGLFEEINVNNVEHVVKGWEKDQAVTLSKFAALVHHIVDLAKSRPDGRLELRHVIPGELEVREQLEDAGETLSERVRAMWMRSKNQGVAVDDGTEDDSEDDGPNNHNDAYWERWILESERNEGLDYTACSADHCGFCGRCSY